MDEEEHRTEDGHTDCVITDHTTGSMFLVLQNDCNFTFGWLINQFSDFFGEERHSEMR